MTWKKIELKGKDTLMCDLCRHMMSDTIMFVYSDDLSYYINEVQCEECYNQGEKN